MGVWVPKLGSSAAKLQFVIQKSCFQIEGCVCRSYPGYQVPRVKSWVLSTRFSHGHSLELKIGMGLLGHGVQPLAYMQPFT